MNAEESELCLLQFLYEYNTKSIVNENTCFKNGLNPSCIDLCVANSALYFQNTIEVSNGLFDKMVVTVLEMTFKKHSSEERHYRGYKYFGETKFKNHLEEKLTGVITNYESIFIGVLKNT